MFRSQKLIIVLLSVIAVSMVACTGLGGEPVIVATIPPPTVTPQLEGITTRADLALGAEIYAANCTACHGPNGAGNGELVQSGQVMNPGNFTDAAAMRGKDPRDYFSIITNGNLQNLMPPWGEALTTEERWAVAMYTYTLHYTEEQIATGGEIYAAECADCHGEAGLGDGPEAVSSRNNAGNLTDPAGMTLLTDENLYNIITQGAGIAMPAYEESLTEDERWAVTAYTRAFSLENIEAVTQSGVVAVADEAAVAAGADVVTVAGIINNGTDGGDVPDDLVVTLHIVDGAFEETTRDTTLEDRNVYRFTDVPIIEGTVYYVSTSYSGRNFAGAPFRLLPEEAETTIDAPILIYEQTSDESVIQIENIISEVVPAPSVMQINQEVVFTNTSDRLFIGDEALPDGRTPSVTVDLPIGAVVVPTFINEDRYIIDEENFTITDTRAILPGQQHAVSLTYLVPYETGAVIDYPVNYPLDGAVIVLIEDEDITLRSDQLEVVTGEVIAGFQGVTYGGSVVLQPGDSIQYELSGAPPRVGTSADSGVVTVDNLLPVVGVSGVVIIVLALGLIIISNRGQGSMPAMMASDGQLAPPQESAVDVDRMIGSLTRQMAELEAQHDTGQINHDLYHQRKRELQTRINNLVGGGNSDAEGVPDDK